MALCGYFPSYVEKNNGQRTIQYEPRHQNAVNDIVQDVEYIFIIFSSSLGDSSISFSLNISLNAGSNNDS